MKHHKLTLLLLAIFLTGAFIIPTNLLADEAVKIAFEENAKRIDLVTGRELPSYTAAERGSIRFHRGRLDDPEAFVTFFHDGIRKSGTDQLFSMEKVQPRFAIWRLRYKRGNKNTPRIHDLAVSFIPITSDTKETARRAYVLLSDMTLIEWGDKE